MRANGMVLEPIDSPPTGPQPEVDCPMDRSTATSILWSTPLKTVGLTAGGDIEETFVQVT